MITAEGRSPEDVVYDELLKDDGHRLLLLALGNYEEGSLDWCEPMLESDDVVLGLGDGGAHYGMICDAAVRSGIQLHHPAPNACGIELLVPGAIQRIGEVDALAVPADFHHLRAAAERS